jgi:hypothetical protein
VTCPYLSYVKSGLGDITGKPKKLASKKIGHFGKSGHLRILNTHFLVLFKTFHIESILLRKELRFGKRDYLTKYGSVFH